MDGNLTLICWDVSGNITVAEHTRQSLKYGPFDTFLITSFMPVILAIGLVGNIAFLFVVFRVPWMRTVTNRYLTHLAIADIIFLVSAVSHALWQFYGSNGIYNEVFLGVAGCVTLPALSDMAHLASISFVTLVSIERYYAVCKPHWHSRSAVRIYCVPLIVISWVVAILMALTFNIPSRKELSSFCVIWPDDEEMRRLPFEFGYCGPMKDLPGIVALLNILNTLPYIASFIINAGIYGVVIITLHKTSIGENLKSSNISSNTAKRNRITAMLLINRFVFFVCLAPFELASLYAVIAEANDVANRQNMRTLFDFCRITVYINSVVNPFLYNAINPRYRLAFFKAFGITCKQLNGPTSQQTQSITLRTVK